MQRKQQEEEEKRKKDEEEAEQRTPEIKSPPKVATVSTQENQVTDFSKNIYDFMNGVETTEDSLNNHEDERSPVRKRGGSSKSSTKRDGSHPVPPLMTESRPRPLPR
jgi:hypothetical protein